MNPAYRKVVFVAEKEIPQPDFSIVTAYNPRGRLADPKRNEREDLRLRRAIETLGEAPARITGMSRDGRHQEPGWTIFNKEEAMRLGCEFFQEAIYQVEKGSLILIDLDSEESEILGPWENFLQK